MVLRTGESIGRNSDAFTFGRYLLFAGFSVSAA